MNPHAMIGEGDAAYLRAVVLEARPRIVIETGTHCGTGSTSVIVAALAEIGAGVCHTWEEHRPFYDYAMAYFRERSEWQPHVVLHCEDVASGLSALSADIYRQVDLVFLDGGDELPSGEPKPCWPQESESLAAFRLIEAHVEPGTQVLVHDWSVPNGRGTIVRDNLDKNAWTVVHVTKSHEGLAHLVRL